MSMFIILSLCDLLMCLMWVLLDEPDIFLINFLVLLLGISMPIVGLSIDYKNAKKQREAEIGGTPLDRFFVECVLSECNDFSKAKNIEKAKLFAQKYAVYYTEKEGIQGLYQKGLQAHKGASQRIESDKLEQLRNKEKKEFEILNVYALYHGKNKRTAMLADMKHRLDKEASSARVYSLSLYKSTQPKDDDWVIWAGIANGLAGPGAALATAMDIQAINARNREEIEANRDSIMTLAKTYDMWADDRSSQARVIEKKLKETEEKIVSDIPADTVMGRLKVVDPKIEVSETGAARITATVKATQKLFIFDDVPAIADGTIIAHVFENGKEIGTANMVLPVDGVSTQANVVGMMLSGAHKDKKQTLTFSADNLWLMEQ